MSGKKATIEMERVLARRNREGPSMWVLKLRIFIASLLKNGTGANTANIKTAAMRRAWLKRMTKNRVWTRVRE